MTLACEAINGKVVNAGENFSFNQLLGRITEANGFKKAPGYSKGMEAQVLGAGVEQVASALYYCALVCDFTILERHNSGYAVKYIDLGLDAYITGSQDLRFTNSSDHPIRILAEVDGNSVRVRIQGTDKRMYDIEIKSVIEETLEPEHSYKVVAKENVMGYEDGQILVSGITGYTVKVYRVKYNKQTGDETIRTIIDVSNYSKRDQVEVQIESDPIEDPQPSDPSEGTESQYLDNVLDVIDEIP